MLASLLLATEAAQSDGQVVMRSRGAGLAPHAFGEDVGGFGQLALAGEERARGRVKLDPIGIRIQGHEVVPERAGLIPATLEDESQAVMGVGETRVELD